MLIHILSKRTTHKNRKKTYHHNTSHILIPRPTQHIPPHPHQRAAPSSRAAWPTGTRGAPPPAVRSGPVLCHQRRRWGRSAAGSGTRTGPAARIPQIVCGRSCRRRLSHFPCKSAAQPAERASGAAHTQGPVSYALSHSGQTGSRRVDHFRVAHMTVVRKH